MNSEIVYSGQSLLDKVVETTGSLEEVFSMALLNGIAITDDVIVGEEVKVTAVRSKGTVLLFNEFNRPATALTNSQIENIKNKGIGYMIVGKTFIVG